MDLSFKFWERQRHLAPEAERILPLIAAAGGLTRKQLGHAVDLERDVLDGLLGGLVSANLLTLAWEGGVPIYRSISRTAQAWSPFA